MKTNAFCGGRMQSVDILPCDWIETRRQKYVHRPHRAAVIIPRRSTAWIRVSWIFLEKSVRPLAGKVWTSNELKEPRRHKVESGHGRREARLTRIFRLDDPALLGMFGMHTIVQTKSGTSPTARTSEPVAATQTSSAR